MSTAKRIYFSYDKDFPNYLLNDIGKLSLWVERRDGTTENITGDANSKIYSLDKDNIFIPDDTNNGTTVDIVFIKEGSGVIKAFFKEDNRTLYTAKQFICHSSFFKDNYLDHFFSSFEKEKLTKFKRVKTTFDTLMEMMDILYAYNEDLKVIPNFSDGKSKFLSLMSQNIGLERIDFTQLNSQYEDKSVEIWKELTANLLDLLSIRGTTLAYELFFGALGYNIQLQEFWYDSDGFLIDINPFDDSLSTFYRYNLDGSFVDDPPIARPDPRRFASPNNDYFKNSKSNIVRVTISNSKNTAFAPEPTSFSSEKRNIISSYLEFLRPSHIQYIKEALGGLSNIDEVDNLEDEFFKGSLSNISVSIDGDPVASEIFDFFGNNPSVYENFTIGMVKNILSEEFGGVLRWDDPNVFWDRGIRWDSKTFLLDSIEIAEV
jgi:hypothetical protein